jgi:hypothetical protein
VLIARRKQIQILKRKENKMKLYLNGPPYPVPDVIIEDEPDPSDDGWEGYPSEGEDE